MNIISPATRSLGVFVETKDSPVQLAYKYYYLSHPAEFQKNPYKLVNATATNRISKGRIKSL